MIPKADSDYDNHPDCHHQPCDNSSRHDNHTDGNHQSSEKQGGPSSGLIAGLLVGAAICVVVVVVGFTGCLFRQLAGWLCGHGKPSGQANGQGEPKLTV